MSRKQKPSGKQEFDALFQPTINALKLGQWEEADRTFDSSCASIKNIKVFHAFMLSRKMHQTINTWLEGMPADFAEDYRKRESAHKQAKRDENIRKARELEKANYPDGFFIPV